MKVCEYCNSIVDDDTTTCPSCSASLFSKKCEVCDTVYKGAACPECAKREAEARTQAEANRARVEAESKANTGLAWKTALTVFLPFVGAWFLLRDGVKKGYRIFAIIWCCFMALEIGLFVTDQGAGSRALAALLCLAPVGVYLFRHKDGQGEQGGMQGKVPLAAFAAVLVVALGGSILVQPEPSEQALDSTETSRTTPAVVPAAALNGSETEATSSSAGESSSASSTASESASTSSSTASGPTANDVTLTATTKYVEYSSKTADPLKLVKSDNADATITAEGELDLTTVGTQTVTYTIELGGQTATQDIKFTVRDTKAPTISFVDAKPKIDAGDSFDALGNMEYVRDKVDGNLVYVEEPPEAQGKEAGLERFYDAGWYTIEGEVDSSTPGTHQLLVTACDKHGNKTTRELLVTVRAAQAEAAGTAAPAAEQHTYIVNVNTGKFHVPGCRDVSRMKESNKMEVTATREEMVARYDPCGHCNP